MPNTSATGGYLLPVSPGTPEQDLDLDVVMQSLVTGLTGLDGTLVRPRWQPTQPRMPDASTTWAAVGVTLITPDDNAVITHDGAGSGRDGLVRHEDIEVLASFYGPQAGRLAGIARDGLHIPQNVEALAPLGIAFVKASVTRPVPELVNQQWVRRVDLPFHLRRIVRRTYPVLNILSAPVSLIP